MLVVLLCLCFSSVTICSAADKKQLAAALAAVDANLATSAGKEYDELIGKEFPDKYSPSVRQCKQSLPAGAAIDPFDMFLKLNAQGKVQEILVYPETQLSGCIRAALLAGKFSSPPHGDYWINIHLQLKR
ncbi:MAG: hypothetical protein WAN03_08040 [Candidatus Sulfotelmatobacter sp.]